MFASKSIVQPVLACLALSLTPGSAAAQAPATVSSEALLDAFRRFCLATMPDPRAFDRVIAEAPGFRKISSPSPFSGVEVNRRWEGPGIILSYTFVPGSFGPECAAGGIAEADFQAAELLAMLALEPGLSLHSAEAGPPGMERTIFIAGDRGYLVVVNVRPHPRGGPDIELLARMRDAAERG